MNLIKRHKGLAIIGGLSLILLIIIFSIFARMLFSTGTSEYGHRLNDVVKIEKKVFDEIITKTKELSEVEDITIRTQGKIVYTTIKFAEGTKIDKAKEIANGTLSQYDDEIIECYDFSYFLKENIKPSEESSEENDKVGFTIAGTKHPKNDKISWTKN